jgi:hypothetical protein
MSTIDAVRINIGQHYSGSGTDRGSDGHSGILSQLYRRRYALKG